MGNHYYGEWIADVERPGVHAVPDGTSNTIFYAEQIRHPDGDYLLTAVEHAAGSEDSRGLWQINAQAGDGSVRKGDWISDVSYESGQSGNAVAMETITIVHEGFMMI